MLVCENCGNVIKECCDIYYEATDENGKDCFLCGGCVEELGLEMPEDE